MENLIENNLKENEFEKKKCVTELETLFTKAEEEGSGEESSACSSFCFGEIRAGLIKLIKKNFIFFFNINH